MIVDDLIPNELHKFCAAMRETDWSGTIVVAGAKLEIECAEVILLNGGKYMIRAIAKFDTDTQH